MVTRHTNFDKTVNTILDRNNIQYKVNHMTVLVLDAIADVAAGAGKAIYRYDSSDNSWILVSKSGIDTMSFDTEELTIVGGQVTAANIPLDNKIWDIQIVDGDVVIAFPRLEDLTIVNGIISGLGTWDGKKIRFTYGYGSVTQQLNSVLATKADIADTTVEPGTY